MHFLTWCHMRSNICVPALRTSAVFLTFLVAFLVRNLFPPDLTSIEFAFSGCFEGFRTISKTGRLFCQQQLRWHSKSQKNALPGKNERHAAAFFDEDLDYPMKCFRSIYGYRMIRWVNVCNIVTIVRNPKHVLKCSTSPACVDSTGGFAPSSTRRWGHGFRIKAELPRLQTPKIRKYSKKCFGSRLQHVRGCFMYVKSNTNKSTSLFESLKSHSVTARKLLEKKRLLGCFRAHFCTLYKDWSRTFLGSSDDSTKLQWRRWAFQVRSCIAAHQIVQLHGRQRHTLHIF